MAMLGRTDAGSNSRSTLKMSSDAASATIQAHGDGFRVQARWPGHRGTITGPDRSKRRDCQADLAIALKATSAEDLRERTDMLKKRGAGASAGIHERVASPAPSGSGAACASPNTEPVATRSRIGVEAWDDVSEAMAALGPQVAAARLRVFSNGFVILLVTHEQARLWARPFFDRGPFLNVVVARLGRVHHHRAMFYLCHPF